MNDEPARAITAAEIEALHADGIVLLKGLFDGEWVDQLRRGVEADMAAPSRMWKDINRGGSGNFFGDTFVWAHQPAFRDFLHRSPAAEVAATVMRSARANLFFDQLLVKEPGTSTPTIWHHDQPFWPVGGTQVATLWLALDPVTRASGAVEYVKGSHRWGKRFKAESFDENEDYGEDLPPIPDIEAMRGELEFARFEMEPGDCTIHHALTVHWAPGNTTDDVRRRAYVIRFAGDDATYHPRPKIQNMLYDPKLTPGGALDSELWPVLWPRPARLDAPSHPPDPRPASG